jgi:hypothetical protein
MKGDRGRSELAGGCGNGGRKEEKWKERQMVVFKKC